MIDDARPVYGVTTGFRALATTPIPLEERPRLQHSLLRSHAAGMGPFVEPEVVRAVMIIRAKTLAARPERPPGSWRPWATITSATAPAESRTG